MKQVHRIAFRALLIACRGVNCYTAVNSGEVIFAPPRSACCENEIWQIRRTDRNVRIRWFFIIIKY